MHIAVCDDNVADRKQLERLLKRESDKRAASTGIIYTDSFGNSTALLSNPMQYDAFYIDMCLTEGTTGTDVVNALTAQGTLTGLIVLCVKACTLAQRRVKDTLADTDALRCDLQQLIGVDEFQCLLKTEYSWR